MKPSRFWLLTLLSASCAVKGFTISDQLPGGSAGGGGNAGTGNQAGSGASQSEGGDGVAGSAPQGGKAGTAGSQSEAGTPTVDGGEPSVGGEGGGGASPSTTAPCDMTNNGLPPLLCDDFESGAFDPNKWSPGPGMTVETGQGPHGPTHLVHLNTVPLGTLLNELPITDVAPVTVSFWFKSMTSEPGQPIVSFRDASPTQSSLFVSTVAKELGWRSSSSNVFVPETPTLNSYSVGSWACVSITLRPSALQLRYQVSDLVNVYEVIADSEPSPNVDQNWSNIPLVNRTVSGYPAFAGAASGASADMFLDDVRIVAGTSNVCDL